MVPSLGLLVQQHNNVAGGPAGKQRPDQLRGHCLVALDADSAQGGQRALVVGSREGARRAGDLPKVILLQVSPTAGAAHAARTLTRVADALALFWIGR